MAAVGEQKERTGDEWFESRNLLQETESVPHGVPKESHAPVFKLVEYH